MARLRGSVADNEAADLTQQWLGRVESVFNELGKEDLSTQMSTFFNAWSNLANKPQDIGFRQVVLQNGEVIEHFQGCQLWINSELLGKVPEQAPHLILVLQDV